MESHGSRVNTIANYLQTTSVGSRQTLLYFSRDSRFIRSWLGMSRGYYTRGSTRKKAPCVNRKAKYLIACWHPAVVVVGDLCDISSPERYQKAAISLTNIHYQYVTR